MCIDIIIIGGGASGLMAAWGAASAAGSNHDSILVLEKMPRPGRKIMITGKGRCNFTNMKEWCDFAPHVRANSNILRPAFYSFSPASLVNFFNENGLESITERGDRVFPSTHKSMDVVDSLVNAVLKSGAGIETRCEVKDVTVTTENDERLFKVSASDGRTYLSKKLIIATGGLSYPSTGSSGDGYRFATILGHSIKQCFPSLTALVPAGYKTSLEEEPDMKGHIDRRQPLSETGTALCGNSLKNVGVRLSVNGVTVQELEGDIDFTDGGIEGPVGFSISRNAVKAIINGGKASISIDLKPGVPEEEFSSRTERLWKEIQTDPRSRGKSIRQNVKVLLGKLMPWEIIGGFLKCNPDIIGGSKGKEVLKMRKLTNAIRNWTFDIAGFVGYERCVITAGGVSCDEVIPKTLESRKCPGLYLCGEVLDIDTDTGGYNLQTAFSTGYLAGRSAALSLKPRQ